MITQGATSYLPQKCKGKVPANHMLPFIIMPSFYRVLQPAPKPCRHCRHCSPIVVHRNIGPNLPKTLGSFPPFPSLLRLLATPTRSG